MDLVIYNMHGPTVNQGYLSDMTKVMAEFRRLNTPASNAGRYTLRATIWGETFVLIPDGVEHTHGYHAFCAPCYAAGKDPVEWWHK